MKNLSVLPSNPELTRQIKTEVRTRRKLERILEASLDMICTFDRRGCFLSVSKACESLLGYTEEEVLGKPYADFVHPDDVEKTTAVGLAIMEGEEIKVFNNSYIRKDGSVVYLMWSATWDSEEEVMYCVARDVTDLKTTQEALGRSNERFQLAMKATSDVIWEWDLLTNELTWTDNFTTLFGYGTSGLQQISSWYIRIHPSDCERVLTGIHKAIEDGTTIWCDEYRYKKADGSYCWVLDSGLILRDQQGKAYRMVGAMQDISQRKEAEEKLALSEQRFRSMVQFGSDLVVIINADGDYTYVSPAVETILGYTPELFMRKNGFDYVHPDDIERTLLALKSVTEKKKVQIPPFRFRNAAGGWRWIDCIATDQSDNPVIRGIVANCRDITEQKQAEGQLCKLALLAKETVNPVSITDQDHKITWVNNAFLRTYEYEEHEVLGKNLLELLSGPKTNPDIVKEILDAVQKKVVYEGEIIYYSKTGKKKIIALQIQPLYDKEGKLTGWFRLHNDITDQRRLQLKLQKEQKERQRKIAKAVLVAQEKERMEIGRDLHDNVNQILATVKLYIETAQVDETLRPEMLTKGAAYVNQAINEIRSISHRLASYTLKNMSLYDSLQALVRNINLARKTTAILHAEGLLEENLSDGLKLAIYRIVQEQMNNVLKYAEAKLAVISLRHGPDELILEIVDDGCGFDPAEKKEGIGLKNIQSRAFAFNGKVEVHSAPGKGCTLVVRFCLAVKN